MELTYHYLMLLNQSAFQKQMYEQLEGMKLSMGQPKILDFLYAHNGCMQKEIAQGCLIEPASVTSVLLKMESSGYIERKNEVGNRRSLYVFLTQKGLEASNLVRDVMEKMEEKALSELSSLERETLLSLLKKVNIGLLENTFVE